MRFNSIIPIFSLVAFLFLYFIFIFWDYRSAWVTKFKEYLIYLLKSSFLIIHSTSFYCITLILFVKPFFYPALRIISSAVIFEPLSIILFIACVREFTLCISPLQFDKRKLNCFLCCCSLILFTFDELFKLEFAIDKYHLLNSAKFNEKFR